MKYNRALDLLCAAAEYRRAGKVNSAANAFIMACADPSIKAAMAIVEANNSVAHAKLVKAAKLEASKQAARKTTATKSKQRAGLETAGEPADDAGEEFRVDPDENGDRVVQEADFDEMVGDDDFDEDDVMASADEDEDDDEEDDDEEEKAEAKVKAKATKATPSANFAQALKNFDALSKR